MQLPLGQESEQALAHLPPLQWIVVRRKGWDRKKISGLGEKTKALQRLRRNAGIHRHRGGADVLYQTVNLALEIHRALDLETVFEAMIKCQSFKQFDNVALEGRAQLRVHFLRQRGLLLELLQVGDEFTKGKIFASLGTQPKRCERFRIANDKNLSQVRFVLLHQYLGQPIDRGEGTVIGGKRLLPVNNEERISRDRVERL